LKEIVRFICFRQWKNTTKNLGGNWQENNLQNAMRAVRTSRLSTNAAAIHYKIPRRTLRAYLAENKQSTSKMGRKTFLSPQSYPRELLGVQRVVHLNIFLW
jgi:hypothetical protein